MADAVVQSSIIDLSRRLETSHIPWSVRRICEFYKKPTDEIPLGDGRLCLPLHQRAWSWTGAKGLKKMRKFIDSVLHDYPIPAIILNAIDDGIREIWQIYDGRHRVETLWRFVHNEFPLIVDEGEPVWYNKEGHRSLSNSDRARFNDRQIPVATTSASSTMQLAEVFIRLNSGKPLKPADYCWASRDTPLIRGTMLVLSANKTRFEPLFGGSDITARNRLPDWVGLFAGIVSKNAGNMSKSFERISDYLDREIDSTSSRDVMDALFTLYERANTDFTVTSSKELAQYQTLGFINAFFLDDWLSAEDKEGSISKWVRVIGDIRTKNDKWLVKVDGAQNLNISKIGEVRKKVDYWLKTGKYHNRRGTGSDSDDSDDE